MRLTFIFIYSLIAAFYLGLIRQLYGQWTGNFPVLPILLLSLLAGFSIAALIRRFADRFIGPRTTAWLAFGGAFLAFWAFGDTVSLVKEWNLLSLRINLTYDDWYTFAVQQALFWFVPLCTLLPLLWQRTEEPRGKLTVFISAMVGLILAHNVAIYLPIRWLIDLSLVLLLLSSALWISTTCSGRWTKGLAYAFALMLLVGWYFGTQRTPYDLRTEVNPFAPIAKRDCLYTGLGTEGVTLKEGRLLRRDGIDRSALTASQLIPVLLKPSARARIACRTEAADPILQRFETGKLKGLYDALWIELPPAWLPTEQDFFRSAALEAAATHLAQNGILVYHLDIRALDLRMLLARALMLQQRFPHVQLWQTAPTQWQIVASRTPITASIEALSALAEDPEISRLLYTNRFESPIALLSCALVSDLSSLIKDLTEPLEPRLPRRAARAARKNLFDRETSTRFSREIADRIDPEMPWVQLPGGLEAEFSSILLTLREGRRLALKGDYKEAAAINPADPYLLALSDREILTARDWERLAEYDKALQSYASAFQIAAPDLRVVLEAARVAQQTAAPARARPFYQLAGQLAPESLAYLEQYAKYLLEMKQPAEAERVASSALTFSETGDLTQLRFFIARCMALQPDKKTQGLALARRIAAAAATDADRARYIPAYSQLLIEVGEFVEGINVKRHFSAYNELLPKPAEKKQEAAP